MPPVLKSFISKNGKKDESEGNIISNGLKCQENITQYCCFYWENRTQINCVYYYCQSRVWYCGQWRLQIHWNTEGAWIQKETRLAFLKDENEKHD